MTLTTSANHIGSDIEFILRRRSYIYIYIYIMNNTGPRIDPLGTPRFNVPPSEKKYLVVVHNLTATFCLLLVK